MRNPGWQSDKGKSTWMFQACQRGRRRGNPRWQRRKRNDQRGSSFGLIRKIFIKLNRFEFGGGTFKYTFLKHFSTWPLIEMNSPSSIVARFPLQGRSEVSKASSGISPSGLKVLGKFNPAQGIELGYFQAIICYISGLWDHIWKCIREISKQNILNSKNKISPASGDEVRPRSTNTEFDHIGQHSVQRRCKGENLNIYWS